VIFDFEHKNSSLPSSFSGEGEYIPGEPGHTADGRCRLKKGILPPLQGFVNTFEQQHTDHLPQHRTGPP